jgi:hypothetical protein
MPGQMNHVTFDFSISADGQVTIFQPTVSGDHDIKASGLDFIWDAVSDTHRTNPRAKLQASVTRKWRFVFVVPKRIAEKWKTARSIEISGSKRKWNNIEQFVVAMKDTSRDQGG